MSRFAPIVHAAGLAAATAIGLVALNPATASAQQFNVRGVVADSAGKPLQGAMVVALTRADSVLVTFDNSAGSGNFTLRRLAAGNYILQVTRIGFAPVRRDFTISNADVKIDTVRIRESVVELEELVVRADQVPIVNRMDTLGYNAAAFRTRPNATVEDLLKLLPGVEVDEEGGIKAQGEDVKQVLVDGKEFFGKDPKVATRNLPSDAINQVQVYDKKSDAAEFTGIDDGQEEKTINLVLKEEARVGYFGRVLAGVGPGVDASDIVADSPGEAARYTGSLNINRFSPSTQLALVANTNNIGQSGFSKDGGGGTQGFSETLSMGINASRDFGKDTWIRSSYSLGSNDRWTDRVTNAQELQGTEVAGLRNEFMDQATDNLSHGINVNAQRAFSSWHQIRFRGNLSVSSSGSTRLNEQETNDLDGSLKNSAVSNRVSDGDNVNGSANLTWRKRLNQAGRSLVAEVSANLSSPESNVRLSSTTQIADHINGGFDTTDVLQTTFQDGRTLTMSQRLGLTEPLGKGVSFELFGLHRSTDEDKLLAVDDLLTGTPIPNEFLSSEFERTYSYWQGGTRLSRNSADLRMVVGLQVQNSNLDGTIIDRDETISNGYTNVLPSANLRYQAGEQSTMSINYRTSTREPSMNELQPSVNNDNPLNVYIGNPNLQPEFTHSVRSDYRFFDQFSFLSIYTYVNASTTRSDIVQARTIDQAGKQETMPINLGNTWSTSGGVQIGSPLRWLGARVQLNYRINRSTGHELINSVENNSRILNHNVGITLENSSKHLFDLKGSVNMGFNDVEYSLNDKLNRSYRSTTLSGSGTWYPSQTWTVNSSVVYNIYDQQLFGEVDNVTFVRASISHQLIDGLAEIELAGVDLLDQNQGVSVTSNANVIQEQRTASLGRQFMVRFSYRLGNRMGGGRGRRF